VTQFFDFTISGLVAGSVYSMLALGLVLLMKSTNIPNFAQGAFGLIGAYVTWWLASEHGVPFIVSLICGVLAAGLVAGLLDRVALRRLLGAPVIALVIVTFGVNIALDSVIQQLWGPDLRQEPQFFGAQAIHLGGVAVEYNALVTFGLGVLIVVALDWFFRRTSIGLATRATATDRTWPQYLGVNVLGVLSLSWVAAGMLGGLGGSLVTGQLFLDPSIMDSLLLASFTAAALGGFTSLWGTYAGGLVVGLAQSWAAGYVSTSSTQWIIFAVLFAVLMIRPAGFARAITERRV
jgi:branched-chain amino acid transport system permease protein